MRAKLLQFVFLALLCLGGTRAFSSQNGAANFEFRDGLIWIKVQVAGSDRPLNFVLDSGAGSSVIDLQGAERAGFKLGETQEVRGVHSRSVAYRVNGFDAQFAGERVKLPVLAIDLSNVSAACHQRIDGLLGADFLRSRVVRIDFRSQQIALLDRCGECGEALPLRRQNDTFCVAISVNGSRRQWMRLDTGCDQALEWVRSGAKADSDRSTSIGLSNKPVPYQTTEIQLGSTHLDHIKTGIHDRAIFPGESGLLGTGVLSRFAITIDGAHSRLVLE